MDEQIITRAKFTDLLDDWYIHMRNQNVEKAQQLKSEIDRDFDDIQENPSLTVYYSLLDFRHKLLEKNFGDAEKLLCEIEKHRDEMDNLLMYYYCFFKGIYAYSKKRYDEAIKNYQMAERLLEEINDPVEQAEFHYKVGSAYFHLTYISFAINHGQKGLDLYTSQNYKKRSVDCKILLGASYKYLGKFDYALFYYEEAGSYCVSVDDRGTGALINKNIGLLYSEKGDSDTAIHYFKLCLKENQKPSIIYFLAKEFFKSGNKVAGSHWIEKGIEESKKTKDNIFFHRFKVLNLVYNKKELEHVLKEAISFLKKEGIWHYVEEYSRQLADYYKHRGQFEQASNYYELVIEAKDHMSLKLKGRA